MKFKLSQVNSVISMLVDEINVQEKEVNGSEICEKVNVKRALPLVSYLPKKLYLMN